MNKILNCCSGETSWAHTVNVVVWLHVLYVLLVRWRRTWSVWEIPQNCSSLWKRSSPSHEPPTPPGRLHQGTAALIYFDIGNFLLGVKNHCLFCFFTVNHDSIIMSLRNKQTCKTFEINLNPTLTSHWVHCATGGEKDGRLKKWRETVLHKQNWQWCPANWSPECHSHFITQSKQQKDRIDACWSLLVPES